MDQQVYMDVETYNGLQQRMLQQNSEQQQQQQFQSQGILIPGNDQTQEVIVQDDQAQHVIYSPMKQNEHQYVSQDDSMQGQYIIQSPQSRQPQQVFFANINQQQQQHTIALNQNLIAQQNQNQQKMVLQSPKVVVQRNNDILQSATSMAQIVDHQNPQTIQYQLVQPQMDQNQTQMISLQQPAQQIKQTIYPQQTNQVSPQHFYLQQIQQPNVVQQGGTKILIQGGSPARYSFIPKPQQQVQQVMQNQAGQIVQVNQQSPQVQTPIRQFRPRMVPSSVRLQNVRMGSPQNVQQIQMVNQQRPRTPKPRVVRPTVQTLQQPVQVNQQQQRFSQPGSKILYIVQTQPDGSTVLVPHPQYNQQQQVYRMVPKVVQTNQSPQQPQQQIQQPQYQVTQMAQPQQPQQVQAAIEDVHAAILAPKKDGDCDDLEDSITATAISKSARSEPPPLTAQSGIGISLEEYRKRAMAVQPNSTRVGVVRPMMNNTGNHMKSPTRNPALQVIRQRPAPRQQFQQGIQEVEVQERESAKMLVILDNGEQRLITFTLPKETCTVQELLDQVGITVGADSNIECIENPGSEIDYIVKVGNFASRDTAAMTKAAENHIRQQQNRLQSQSGRVVQSPQQIPQPGTEAKTKGPDVKLPPTKLVPGYYAVCPQCGISGTDHAKCQRCNFVFTEMPKMQRMPTVQPPKVLQGVASSTQTQKVVTTIGRGNIDKKDQIEALQKKHQLTVSQKAGRGGRGGMVTSTPRAKPVRKAKNAVPEIVTLSSDDEEGTDEVKKQEEIPRKPFEPEIIDEEPAEDFVRQPVDQFGPGEERISTSITCRTIRIGTYKFDSKEKVVITSKGIRIVAPSVTNPKDVNVLDIQQSEIVKVVVHFSKQLHIIFLYTTPFCARYISAQLEMSKNDASSAPFYSPVSRKEPQRKIVFLAESISEDAKSILKSIYVKSILEEINNRDANEMLVRSTGIPLLNASVQAATATPNNTIDGSNIQEIENRKLLIYPPGRGGISVSTNDYICLGTDNYLNDVIIDFYLQYLFHEILTEEQRAKTHIFSQFFYKRLTTLTKDKDIKLSAAQKRHNRVASWTKNVNLFEKDFIIIPINEQSHWFLAIICFAHLSEPHTMDTNQPIKLIPAQKRAKKKATPVQIGNTTITPLSKKEETINLGDDERSERDEAEGDESDLGSNIESEDEEVVDRGQAVKLPCILIFDSLLGAPRARVVATLRDYLTCEYKAKFPTLAPRVYSKSNIFGNQVKVPQQNNFTDCGVFLLQYVEHFFTDPIKDFRVPLQTHINWFHQDIVTRKREEIAKLIEELIKRSKPDGIELPEILFPSKDGKILEQAEEATADSAFDDEEYVPTEEDINEANQNGASLKSLEETRRVLLPKKRSLDKTDSSSGESTAKTPKFNSSRNKS